MAAKYNLNAGGGIDKPMSKRLSDGVKGNFAEGQTEGKRQPGCWRYDAD